MFHTFHVNFTCSPSVSAMKYHIVQFSDGIVVVCDSWMNAAKKSCYIPSKNVWRQLNKDAPPDKEKWSCYQYLQIIMSHGK